MAEDYYGDGMEQPAPAENRKGKKETTLVPKSMCPGMEIGDSITFKIVGDQNKEYLVEYAKKEKPEAEEPMRSEIPMEMETGGPPSAMGSMMG